MPKNCSNCNSSKISEIIYGYVLIDDKLQHELDSGKIVLGGCLTSEDQPNWQCNECGIMTQ